LHGGRIDGRGARRLARAQPQRIARRLPGQASPPPSSGGSHGESGAGAGSYADLEEAQLVGAAGSRESDAERIALRDAPKAEASGPGRGRVGGQCEPRPIRHPRTERHPRRHTGGPAWRIALRDAPEASSASRDADPKRKPKSERHAEEAGADIVGSIQTSRKEARRDSHPLTLAVRDPGAQASRKEHAFAESSRHAR
jgi:hypothetical protein